MKREKIKKLKTEEQDALVFLSLPLPLSPSSSPSLYHSFP